MEKAVALRRDLVELAQLLYQAGGKHPLYDDVRSGRNCSQGSYHGSPRVTADQFIGL